MRNADRAARLARYGATGACSTLTHVGVLFVLVEALHADPVAGSTAGFVASILVSYALQRYWVFRSAQGHLAAGAKFLTVTAVAFGVNTATLALGTELFALPYQPVQLVALVLIPIVNYTLNAAWTFRR
jgi:putative flippase GtrA